MRVGVSGRVLVADFGEAWRAVSSAVLGGGTGAVRTWINAQVEPGYARTDPEAHLRELARGRPGPVVGMLTAADVGAHRRHASGVAQAVVTVGIGQPLAAAGRRPRAVPAVGTINLLAVIDAPLSPAGAIGAVQTAVEAKAQALADAGVRAHNHDGHATGTATDAICLAFRPGASEAFAGPATAAGAALAQAVHGAVLAGAQAAMTERSIEEAAP